ncbi:MAG TPA: LCP family protein [Streptosporangiaceae bacterium]|nr:LCP family protein [Streptosporangiaceae bacterium]
MRRYARKRGRTWQPPRLGRGHDSASGPRQSLRTRIAAWTSVSVVAVLVLAVLAAYVKYRVVWDSIGRVAVTDLGNRPPRYTSALNILVFGSDNRSKLTAQQRALLHTGNDTENSTDSIMIVHVSPGRRGVTIVNLPRDTMVPYYACPAGQGAGQSWSGQQASPGSFERINAVFNNGGPSCLWKTVEQQTRIRLDHFIELGLTSMVKVVNDLGGVNVCVPFAVDIPKSGLRLPAGERHIGGVQALAFWRTREDIGTGSDLQRIQRDQYLAAQVLQGVLHSGLLSSPARLLSVIGDAAAAMTTDTGFSQSDMLQLAESFRGLPARDVQFVTAPNVPYPANPNELSFAQPQAGGLFRAIAHDATLPSVSRTRHRAAAPPVLDAAPGAVRVQVLNGSGVSGVASRAAAALAGRGFVVTGTGDAASFGYTSSVIEYASATSQSQVNTLEKQLTSVTVRRDPSLAPGTIDLILGANFTALASHPATSHPAAKRVRSSAQAVGTLARSYGGTTGAASCKSDTAAFTGPNSPGG